MLITLSGSVILGNNVGSKFIMMQSEKIEKKGGRKEEE